MKAVRYKKYGSPDVIVVREESKPVLKEQDILIHVETSVISPAECAFRSGTPFIVRFFNGLLKPKYVAGDILSGTVVDIGSKVQKFKVGDEVYGSTGTTLGAQAEYSAVAEGNGIAVKPKAISFSDGAAMADGAITALPFLRDTGEIKKGSKVLINGGSGSVGTYAIQIAKHYGAHVTAVNSGKNETLVLGLGADEFIDYTKENFTDQLDTYDIIFDAVGKSSYKKCKKALKKTGIYMSTVPTFSLMLHMLLTSKRAGKKAKFSATGLRKPEDKVPDFDLLSQWAVDGKLKTVIDKTYTLDKIQEAHQYVDGGHKQGNVILKF